MAGLLLLFLTFLVAAGVAVFAVVRENQRTNGDSATAPVEESIALGEKAVLTGDDDSRIRAAALSVSWPPKGEEESRVSQDRVGVEVALRNLGSLAFVRAPGEVSEVVDQAGRTYPAVAANLGSAQAGWDKVALAPGEARKGTFVFDVSDVSELRSFRLKLGESQAVWGFSPPTYAGAEPGEVPGVVDTDLDPSRPATVPDLVGMRWDVAGTVAGQAGLDAYPVNDEPVIRDNNWVVVAQEPAAGTVVPYASDVAVLLERIDTGL